MSHLTCHDLIILIHGWRRWYMKEEQAKVSTFTKLYSRHTLLKVCRYIQLTKDSSLVS